MLKQYEAVRRLTDSPHLTTIEIHKLLNDFAIGLGWQPVNILNVAIASDLATAHLMVEHGLENTAVITFLSERRPYADLTREEKTRLLSISYNNLVDWHIHVEIDGVTFAFNRLTSPEIESFRITRDNYDKLRSDAFEKIVGRKPNPNIPRSMRC